MGRLIAWIVGLPLAVVLVLLAVANRAPVLLSLDPFSAEVPAYSLRLPLFAVIFLAIVAGILIGGLSTWIGQGHWRREARARRRGAGESGTERRRRHEPDRPQLALPPRA